VFHNCDQSPAQGRQPRVLVESKQRREKMKRILAALVLACLLLAGCDSLRFAPSEAQKQNAWLHNRTAIITAETARAQDASQELQSLTQLSELQSRAFSSYCGLPKEFPQAETVEDILSQSNWQLARTALAESSDRPDTWQVADSMLELGIGICALLGGVYGTRVARFLAQARAKSKALHEIIAGNELFKKQNDAQASAFKQAHQSQSPATRQIVAQMKT
jgi:outer membrane murein-binding lipoprotein Lpp